MTPSPRISYSVPMLPTGRNSRIVFGGFLVLASSLLTVFMLRGWAQEQDRPVPDFRKRGDPHAKVQMVEFSDFQCPACQYAEGSVKNILSFYGKDIVLIFKNFPLERPHRWAHKAAIAAECAGKLGQFWPFHDQLYAKQQEWSVSEKAGDFFLAYAKQFGINDAAFNTCLSDPSVEKAIAADMKEGNQRWVNSTPTFFINGKRFAGATQLSSRGSLWIDKILKKK